ncbi:MAG: hypothetical protein Q7J40_01205 [Atribacterota bacterium]|nr:hypothetical protein [Atribacterota bacterium]
MKNFKIEKDPELEDLLAKSKKKGLKFGLLIDYICKSIRIRFLCKIPYKKLKKVTELLTYYKSLLYHYLFK